MKNSLSVASCCLRARIRLRPLKESGSMASSLNGREPHVQACATPTHFTFTRAKVNVRPYAKERQAAAYFVFVSLYSIA